MLISAVVRKSRNNSKICLLRLPYRTRSIVSRTISILLSNLPSTDAWSVLGVGLRSQFLLLTREWGRGRIGEGRRERVRERETREPSGSQVDNVHARLDLTLFRRRRADQRVNLRRSKGQRNSPPLSLSLFFSRALRCEPKGPKGFSPRDRLICYSG